MSSIETEPMEKTVVKARDYARKILTSKAELHGDSERFLLRVQRMCDDWDRHQIH